jgi:two-component system, cell cycle sensor histidine kinase and response regulator CckA
MSAKPTDHRTAQRQSRTKGASLAFPSGSLLDAIDLGLTVYRLENPEDPASLTVTAMNKTGERFSRIACEDVIGKRIGDAFPGTRGTGRAELYAEVIRSGKALDVGDIVYADARLGERRYSVRAVPLPDNCVGIIQADITERRRAEEEIRSLARFPAENPNPVLRLSGNGKVLYANEAGRTFLSGRGSARSNSAPRFLRALAEEALTKQASTTVDVEHGGRVWSLFVAPIVDSGYVNFYGRDITVRKRAEEQLRTYAAIVENMDVGACIYHLEDPDDPASLRLLAVNEAGARMGGAKAEEVVGKLVVDALPASDPDALLRNTRVARSGVPERSLRHYPGDSQMAEAYFETDAVPLGNDMVAVLFKDITERKRTEEELRVQSSALQAAANGIVITDREGRIQWVNPAFTRLTGYSAAEAMGQNPRVLKSGRHDRAFYHKLWHTILAGGVWQGEIVNKRKDGALYTEEMTITPVLDAGGVITHFIAIKQDITERKELEAALERTRSEFIGEVSHELKTPLTAIKGCASMALSAGTPADPEARELFEIIDAQANRLTDLVANLLDVTRIEAGRLSMEPGPADLAKIVEEAKVIFEHSQYPHSLEVLLPPKLPVLRADGRRIVQVLANLFSNAAKYSSPTAPIILSAECAGEEVTVHVRDSGIGIPGDKMSLLFQKFVQVHERGARGTGLGLFICKGIIEAHGGRIWVESAGSGKGAVFSFTLPVLKEKRPAKRADSVVEGAGEPGGRAYRQAGRRIRIVAVDDEPDILRYIEYCLRSARYEVASTSDPLAATELVRSHSPDIVLLDMRMPGRSGLDVLEEIRKFSKVPVAFITATGNREDVIRGREFGGTTWLEKPFSPQQLLDHVGIVLARKLKR